MDLPSGSYQHYRHLRASTAKTETIQGSGTASLERIVINLAANSRVEYSTCQHERIGVSAEGRGKRGVGVAGEMRGFAPPPILLQGARGVGERGVGARKREREGDLLFLLLQSLLEERSACLRACVRLAEVEVPVISGAIDHGSHNGHIWVYWSVFELVKIFPCSLQMTHTQSGDALVVIDRGPRHVHASQVVHHSRHHVPVVVVVGCVCVRWWWLWRLWWWWSSSSSTHLV